MMMQKRENDILRLCSIYEIAGSVVGRPVVSGWAWRDSDIKGRRHALNLIVSKQLSQSNNMKFLVRQ